MKKLITTIIILLAASCSKEHDGSVHRINPDSSDRLAISYNEIIDSPFFNTLESKKVKGYKIDHPDQENELVNKLPRLITWLKNHPGSLAPRKGKSEERKKHRLAFIKKLGKLQRQFKKAKSRKLMNYQKQLSAGIKIARSPKSIQVQKKNLKRKEIIINRKIEKTQKEKVAKEKQLEQINKQIQQLEQNEEGKTTHETTHTDSHHPTTSSTNPIQGENKQELEQQRRQLEEDVNQLKEKEKKLKKANEKIEEAQIKIEQISQNEAPQDTKSKNTTSKSVPLNTEGNPTQVTTTQTKVPITSNPKSKKRSKRKKTKKLSKSSKNPSPPVIKPESKPENKPEKNKKTKFSPFASIKAFGRGLSRKNRSHKVKKILNGLLGTIEEIRKIHQFANEKSTMFHEQRMKLTNLGYHGDKLKRLNEAISDIDAIAQCTMKANKIEVLNIETEIIKELSEDNQEPLPQESLQEYQDLILNLAQTIKILEKDYRTSKRRLKEAFKIRKTEYLPQKVDETINHLCKVIGTTPEKIKDINSSKLNNTPKPKKIPTPKKNKKLIPPKIKTKTLKAPKLPLFNDTSVIGEKDFESTSEDGIEDLFGPNPGLENEGTNTPVPSPFVNPGPGKSNLPKMNPFDSSSSSDRTKPENEGTFNMINYTPTPNTPQTLPNTEDPKLTFATYSNMRFQYDPSLLTPINDNLSTPTMQNNLLATPIPHLKDVPSIFSDNILDNLPDFDSPPPVINEKEEKE